MNECTVDDDCENPLKCKENHCVPECTQHEDCPDDMNCVQQQCRTGCEVNEDCREGACLDGACVSCRKNSDCGEGKYCQFNNCIDCAEDEHCEGVLVCKNNKCVPPCSDNSDCSGDTPVCSEKGCVQCLDSKDCSGNELCLDNVCKLECTEDYDCDGDQKCNLSDNHCYECLENADCLGGKRCVANKCEAALPNDWDADGVADDQDRCPYNPNVTTQEDADCNYVTDPDGTRVFEVWHASDFPRLRKDLPGYSIVIILFMDCDDVNDPACCGLEGQAPWSNTCTDENTVQYCDWQNYIRTGGCEFGCANGNCRSCRPANTPTESGDCCSSSYPNQCKDDTYFMECKDGKLDIRACGGGCNNGECKFCREADPSAPPQPNDCCDASTFVEICSTDKKSTLRCVDGRVEAIDCNAGECRPFGDGVNFCVAKPAYSFHVRLMRDINLADIQELTDKPFEPIEAPYKKTITNDDNTSTEVLMVPGESDYEPFQITDAPCVMSWNPLSLYQTEFDGQSHRIFVKNSDNQSCSLESSFFDEVRESTLKNISFNYNKRGDGNWFASRYISHSGLESVRFIGNIHGGRGILGTAEGSSAFDNIRFKGNIASDYFVGLFNEISKSVVSKITFTVPDYFLSYTSGYSDSNVIAQRIYNSIVDVPTIDIHWIGYSGSKADFATVAAVIENSRIQNGLSVRFGDVFWTGSDFTGLAFGLSQFDMTGKYTFRAGDIKTSKLKIITGRNSNTSASVRIPEIEVNMGNVVASSFMILAGLSGEDNLLGKSTINLKDVEANSSYDSTFNVLSGGKNLTINEAHVTAGNIKTKYFNTISRLHGNSTVQNITASFKNVVAQSANVVAGTIDEGSRLSKVKVIMDNLVGAQQVNMIEQVGGAVDSVAVRINHLQAEQNLSANSKWEHACVNGIHTLNSNASVENMSIYADVYIKANADNYDVENMKETVATGLFYNGSGENIHLKNIFSAMRISKYTEVDSETGRPTDAKIIHNYPHALSGIGKDDLYLQSMDGENGKKTYRLDWSKDIDRVYWLKRDPADADWSLYPSELTTLDGLRALFPGIAPDITDLILQPSMSVTVDQTLSGCEDMSSESCETPWSSVLLDITEPNGETISIPWLKSF